MPKSLHNQEGIDDHAPRSTYDQRKSSDLERQSLSTWSPGPGANEDKFSSQQAALSPMSMTDSPPPNHQYLTLSEPSIAPQASYSVYKSERLQEDDESR